MNSSASKKKHTLRFVLIIVSIAVLACVSLLYVLYQSYDVNENEEVHSNSSDFGPQTPEEYYYMTDYGDDVGDIELSAVGDSIELDGYACRLKYFEDIYNEEPYTYGSIVLTIDKIVIEDSLLYGHPEDLLDLPGVNEPENLDFYKFFWNGNTVCSNSNVQCGITHIYYTITSQFDEPVELLLGDYETLYISEKFGNKKVLKEGCATGFWKMGITGVEAFDDSELRQTSKRTNISFNPGETKSFVAVDYVCSRLGVLVGGIDISEFPNCSGSFVIDDFTSVIIKISPLVDKSIFIDISELSKGYFD